VTITNPITRNLTVRLVAAMSRPKTRGDEVGFNPRSPTGDSAVVILVSCHFIAVYYVIKLLHLLRHFTAYVP
jgi:hypothetical protein